MPINKDIQTVARVKFISNAETPILHIYDERQYTETGEYYALCRSVSLSLTRGDNVISETVVLNVGLDSLRELSVQLNKYLEERDKK